MLWEYLSGGGLARIHTADGRNMKKSSTTWDAKIPVSNGINYQPQLVQPPDFWTINSTSGIWILLRKSNRNTWLDLLKRRVPAILWVEAWAPKRFPQGPDLKHVSNQQHSGFPLHRQTKNIQQPKYPEPSKLVINWLFLRTFFHPCYVYRLKHLPLEGPSWSLGQKKNKNKPKRWFEVPNAVPPRHDQHRWSAKLQNGLWYFDLIESMVFSWDNKKHVVCVAWVKWVCLPNIVLFPKIWFAWIIWAGICI